jgi:PAS domain-containing protein
VRFEWRARRLDGAEFTADVRMAVLEWGGRRAVQHIVARDVTERRRVDELRRAAEVELGRAKPTRLGVPIGPARD